MIMTKARSLGNAYITPETEEGNGYSLVRISHGPQIVITTFGKLRIKGCWCTVISTDLSGKSSTRLIADYPSVMSAEIGHVKWSEILLSPKTLLVPEERYLRIMSFTGEV